MPRLWKHRFTAVSKIIQVVVCSCIILTLNIHPWATPWAMAGSSRGEILVQKGIDQYQRYELDLALEFLRQAEEIFPESTAVPYYRGLIYLEKDNREEAVRHWRKYLSMVPEDENTRDMSKHITILLRRAAKAYARKAVKEPDVLLDRPMDDNAVAVAAFKNLGSDSLAPLGKGMAAMIIADLSHFKDLKVVEREKLQALLTEMELGTSGLVDEESAPEVGKLLRAKYVTSGSMVDPQKVKLQMASILLETGKKTVAGGKDVNGELSKFYEMEKDIACGIAKDLGQDCADAPEAFGKIHTKSMAAFQAYSYGLDYLDEENYDEARIMFQKAVKEDPQFDLARTALLFTPTAAMLLLTESQIIGSASAGAPSAAATSSTAALSVGAGGGVGMGTTAAVAGGVVVLGGAVALAGDDDGNGEDPSPEIDLSGQWHGVWSDQADGSGSFALQLSQDGNTLGGEATITGTDCMSSANISGDFNGERVTLNLSSAAAAATLSAQITSATEMTGNISFTSGTCVGEEIQVSVQKTGGAVVEW